MFVVFEAGRFILPSLFSENIRWADGTSSGKEATVQEIEHLPPGFRLEDNLSQEVRLKYPSAQRAIMVDADAVRAWALSIKHDLRPAGS
jgi:hypothetical protein